MNASVCARRKTLLALVALIGLSSATALGDPLILKWSRSHSGLGGAEGHGVVVSPQGIYVTGRTWPPGGDGVSDDVLMLKYDTAGNLLWDPTYRSWGGTRVEEGWAVSASATHVYAAGYGYSYAYDPVGGLEPDAFTVRWTHNGDIDCSNSPDCWFTRFSGDSGYYATDANEDIAHDAAGNFFVVGVSERATANPWAFVEKYDSAGVKQWHRHYGVTGYQKWCDGYGLAFSQDAVYTGGSCNAWSPAYQVQVLKHATDGTLLWSFLWGETGVDYRVLDLAVNGSDLYVTGYRAVGGDWPNSDAFLTKLHDDGGSGSYMGNTVFVNPGRDYGWGVTLADGRIYVVGAANNSGQTDALLLVYDTDLNLLWQHTWGGTGNDAAYDVAYSNGVVYVTGGLGGTAFLDAYEVDSDSDGVPDNADNCPTVANPTQVDTDHDGVGDVCDNCPNTPNPDQANSDPDPLGDACDPCIDPNSSGVCIPTLTEWGMVAMAALILSAGGVVIARRRAA